MIYQNLKNILAVGLFVASSISLAKEIKVTESVQDFINKGHSTRSLNHEYAFRMADHVMSMEIVEADFGETIRIKFPVSNCEEFPAYYIYKEGVGGHLFFFSDTSNRRFSTDVGCSDTWLVYELTKEQLLGAVPGRQWPGLLFTSLENHWSLQEGKIPSIYYKDINFDREQYLIMVQLSSDEKTILSAELSYRIGDTAVDSILQELPR